MAGRRLLIQVTNERIYLNPTLSLAIAQTNIPRAHLLFRTSTPIFWETEMQRYDEPTQCLYVEVTNYRATRDDERFAAQRPKKPVQRLEFAAFDWPELEPLLAHYKKIELQPFVKNLEAPLVPSTDKPSEKLPAVDGTASQTVREKFAVDLSEVRIELGYVAFRRWFERFEREIDFRIENACLLPEFDYIKFWFAKKLGQRKITVDAAITFAGGEVRSVEASSKQIASIGPAFIDAVRRQRVGGLTKLTEPAPDKSLFTADDIFNTLDDTPQGNVFRQNEKDILDLLLADTRVRNRQQLAYLAGAKQSPRFPLRFTLAPDFGFLFFIEGETKNHFVWELLNSHATYLWSLGKTAQDAALQYRRIEATLNAIRQSGRDQYRRAYRDDRIDPDLTFNFIEHEKIGSQLVDAFPKWKHRLEALLV
jgi:hypothetical protein